VKIVKAPLRADFTADVAAMEKLITRNTIALAGSAPNYPYGTIDPVAELGALAQRNNLPLHVDCCLGGFFLPWVEKLGAQLPLFDFRVPGVTSISADIHKYGYSAKGASTILYRNQDLFRDQIFAEVNWCGGVYGGPTMAGTRPGGAIAAAWASLQALGEEGYMENARRVMEVAAQFKEGVAAVPGLYVLGQPAMGVFAYGASDKRVSIYAVADRLEEKGWHIDRLQKPESIHLILNPGHAAIVREYLEDLREAVTHVRDHPDTALEGSAPMYGLIAKAPMRSMVRRNVVAIFANLYAQRPGTGQEGEETEDAAPGVPAPVLLLMRIISRVKRIFGC
jgi:glutamate/tyrosine decarboxylase-like PLP-dependent enzyme